MYFFFFFWIAEIVCIVDFNRNLGFGITFPNLLKFYFPRTNTAPTFILTQFMKAQELLVDTKLEYLSFYVNYIYSAEDINSNVN